MKVSIPCPHPHPHVVEEIQLSDHYRDSIAAPPWPPYSRYVVPKRDQIGIFVSTSMFFLKRGLETVDVERTEEHR